MNFNSVKEDFKRLKCLVLNNIIILELPQKITFFPLHKYSTA